MTTNYLNYGFSIAIYIYSIDIYSIYIYMYTYICILTKIIISVLYNYSIVADLMDEMILGSATK